MSKSVTSLNFIPTSERRKSHPSEQGPDRFLVGPENALLRVLYSSMESRTARCTPVVLFGATGVGKTHFLLGLVARFQHLFPDAKVIHSVASDFARGFAEAVELDSMAEFRAKNRRVDLLAMDGLEEIGNKKTAQYELAHTLDALRSQKRHVVLTARSSPSELSALVPGLRSRLSEGLTIPVVIPSAETRKDLLRDLGKNHSVVLPKNVINALAEGTGGNPSPLRTAPELQNAIHELRQRELGNDQTPNTQTPNTQTLNIQTALRFLANRSDAAKPTLRHVTKQVARYFRLRVGDLTGPSRRQAPVRARGIAMYLARELTGASFQSIGRQFDRRDHTTVLHAYRRTEELIRTEPEIKQAVEELIEQFRGG